MIIVGYPGITFWKGWDVECIDLDSGNFVINGKRRADWYKEYVRIAEDLSNQGYFVFVSSHKVVREELRRLRIPFAACYPEIGLKDKWIKKLRERYEGSRLEKDSRALENVERVNVRDLEEDSDYRFVIKNMEYDSKDLIREREWII